MSNPKSSQELFDDNGRRIPYKGVRVFNEVSLQYYKINQPKIDFQEILLNSQKHAGVGSNITVKSFESACLKLKGKIQKSTPLRNLLKGVCIPFICPKSLLEEDLGKEFEQVVLPSVASSFKEANPNLHYRVALQGDSKLSGQLSVATESRYEKFIEMHRSKVTVGWYFPQALQEYDISSQRDQMKTLPLYDGLILSGGLDVAAALVGSPGLLINDSNYPPVLCISSFKHSDENLMLCFKSYGQHLEFWGMSQMLCPGEEQVSEQWSGGLTIFSTINE